MVTVLEGKITDAEKKNHKLINSLLSLEIAMLSQSRNASDNA
tara:strand:- start:152 stop:277 length:126 start_codon:yes stop_codon:yes gene_type:complete